MSGGRRLRVIQWGPGRLGTFALRTLLQRAEEFDVVGVLAYSDSKAGTDVGELVGLPTVGIAVTTDKDAIVALDADIVVFTPMIQADGKVLHEDALALLASGKNLILAHDYFWPGGVSALHASEVEAACNAGQSTVMGVGTSPGFVSERLAATLTGHCLEVEHIDVLERMDCTPLDARVYPKLGFGLPPESFPRDAIVAMFEQMYRQTPYAVAAILGQELQRVECAADFAVAARDVPGTSAKVETGTIAGMSFSTVGYVRDRPFFTLSTRWVCDLEIPGWEVDNDWVITIEGTPALQLNYKRGSTFVGGVRHAGSHTDPGGEDFLDPQSWTTVAALVNAIPEVCAAPPGHLVAPVFGACRHVRGDAPLVLRP